MSQTPPPVNQPDVVSETSGKAIASLVVSILGLTSCGVLGIVGVLLGHSAMSDIRASQGRLTGDGVAKAGIIIGWIGVALVLLGMLGACVWFMIAALVVAAG